MKRLVLDGSDPLEIGHPERYYWYDGNLRNIQEMSKEEVPFGWAVDVDGGETKYKFVRTNGWFLTPKTLLGTKLRWAIFAKNDAIFFDDGLSTRNVTLGDVSINVRIFFMVMKVSVGSRDEQKPQTFWCRYRLFRGNLLAPELEAHQFEPISDIFTELNGPNHSLWVKRWMLGADIRNLFMRELE